jgi:hypothetical protein
MTKTIPEFGNEDEERDFWAAADSTEYIDWNEGTCAKLVRLIEDRDLTTKLP